MAETTAAPEPETGALGQVQKYAMKIAEPEGFHVFSAFAEHHGSWELTLHRDEHNLHRFLSIALTPGAKVHHPQFWIFEIWAGAEQGTRYCRLMVLQTQVGDAEISSRTFTRALSRYLEKGLRSAIAIRPQDLTEQYTAPPRASAV